MIAYINGTIHSLQEDGSILVVIGGVGYEVFVPSTIYAAACFGEQIELYTFHYVREDIFDLYGFTTQEDLRFFRQLIQVSGVGPKLALSILSSALPDDIKRAIIAGDSDFLKRIHGVGKKTAERIVLDLQDKVVAVAGDAQSATAASPAQLTAVDALESLGYSQREAQDALHGVDTTIPIEEQIREALQRLAIKR